MFCADPASTGGVGVGQVTGVHGLYALSVFAGLGWAGFVALFLGWLAAMLGCNAGTEAESKSPRESREIRPAA